MNKKQKNRKIVTQNKRNRMINRRYTSMIKSLSKLFTKKIKDFSVNKTDENILAEKNQSDIFNQTKTIVNNLYSIIDKAVKKRVIHKNTAARKKSNLKKVLKTTL